MFYFLKNKEKFQLPKVIQNLLQESKYIFNPSYLLFEGISYLAIRYYNTSTKNIDAHLYTWKSSNDSKLLDLSSFFKDRAGILKVADPKIFIMDGAVWMTFNTGHTTVENNHLYLAKVGGNSIEVYYDCLYNERQVVEKNWGFYSENKTIFALYSLAPFTTIKLNEINGNQATFEKHHIDPLTKYKNTTIGSPLVKYEDSYLFIVHNKFYKNKKRLYFGKPAIFDSKNQTLIVKNKRLLHSLKSLFGNSHKFNKNLISCSYFSGLSYVAPHWYVSYGINDATFNIIKLKKPKLWQ